MKVGVRARVRVRARARVRVNYIKAVERDGAVLRVKVRVDVEGERAPSG